MNIESTIKAGTDKQPTRMVIFAGDSLDDAQASGRWLSSDKSIHRKDWQ